MKRFLLLLTVVVLVCMMAMPAAAGPKKSTLGIGSYAVVIDSDGYKDNFFGIGIFGSTAISRNLVLRAGIYGTAHEDYEDDFTLSGIDLQMLFGKNLARRGFKFYAGLDYFKETVEIDLGGLGTFEDDYSDLGLILGLGYNFRNVAIDWYGVGRSNEEYGDGVDVGAGSLMISMRF